MLRRLLGFIMLLSAITGIILSIGIGYAGSLLTENVTNGLVTNLTLTSDTLVNVRDTLALTKATVSQVNVSMATVRLTAVDAAHAITTTQPLLEETAIVATQQLPDALEAFETAIPQIAEVAGVMDDTLTTLSNFQIEQNILGATFGFDLGIDYEPTVPFDETILQLGATLEGIPEQLRSLDVHLVTAESNLETISVDIITMSDDLGTINAQIAQLVPLLDEYVRVVDQINSQVLSARAGAQRQAATAKLVFIVIGVWFGLTQLAPLYLGMTILFWGGLDKPPEETVVVVADSESPAAPPEDTVKEVNGEGRL